MDGEGGKDRPRLRRRDQGDVAAAEAERAAEHGKAAALADRGAWRHQGSGGSAGSATPLQTCGGRKAGPGRRVEHQPQEGRFATTGGTQADARSCLWWSCTAPGCRTRQPSLRLHDVVQGCAGAVQVDIGECRRRRGIVDRQLHSLPGTAPVRVRRGRVMGVGGFAHAQQADRAFLAGQQEGRRPFADVEAVAPQREGVA